MKLFINNHYLKSIPVRFQRIAGIEDYIDDLESKRLSPTERKNMTAALMQQTVRDFISDIQNNQSLSEHIKASEPITAAKIITRTNAYYVIVFANNSEVRCSFQTYQSAPVKTIIKRLY